MDVYRKKIYHKKKLLKMFKETENGWLLDAFSNEDSGLFRFEKEFEKWIDANFEFIGVGYWRKK